MKQLRYAAVGFALALALFVAFGLAYRSVRHSRVESDELTVLGAAVETRWTSVAPLPSGRGLVSNPPLIATAQTDRGQTPSMTSKFSAMYSDRTGTTYVTMKSPDPIPIDVELVSRDIENRFGSTLLTWQCRAQGAVARDGSEFYLFIDATGGGDAGYTVMFDTTLASDSTFMLTITERLWSNKARQCELSFRVNDDGTIDRITGL